MPYGETKVYFDGSHYIAIPHTTRPTKRRPKPLEEKIVVVDKVEEENGDKPFPELSETEVESTQQPAEETREEMTTEPTSSQPTTREMTRKELFEELYEKSKEMRKGERKRFIVNGMIEHFPNNERTEEYVTKNLERKLRNLICRRIRLWRKFTCKSSTIFALSPMTARSIPKNLSASL